MTSQSLYSEGVKRRVLGSALALLIGGTACAPESSPMASQSLPDSVEIPQTPVENQLRIGFCWAYAVVGLIESDYKVRTGQELQLSEEALGFYRMVEGIYYLTQNLRGEELIENIRLDTFQGWVLKDEEIPDSFDLVKLYGVIPEAVWSLKFDDADGVEKMVTVIRNSLNKLVFDRADPREITKEEIIEEVLVGSGAWKSAPPETFEWEGKTYTPKSYLKSLEFDPERFVSVIAKEKGDVEKIISATKRALVRGVSVPIGYPVNFDRLDVDTFTGQDVDLDNWENFFRDGGHAVLIEDFVNDGGKEGALPFEQVVIEFLRPTKELDYFTFKNSWGTEAKFNEAGIIIDGSETGYYKIDREYLVGSANLSALPEFRGFLEVVVPADIASDPFGKEDVNPVVALP